MFLQVRGNASDYLVCVHLCDLFRRKCVALHINFAEDVSEYHEIHILLTILSTITHLREF